MKKYRSPSIKIYGDNMDIKKSDLEEKIANYISRKYCLLVGRATTAIYLAIKAYGFRDGNIIIPSIVCPNPIFPVIYNDLEPKFCDINLNDFTLDINSFKKQVNENTKAVIPINLYGYPANYDKIIPFCKENNIKVIEDAAQSFGGSYNGKKMGSFGDISVISFGHTKIIDVNAGGAILTDDLDIFNQIKLEYKKLDDKPNNINERGELYRKIYYTLQPFWQENDDLYYLYSPFPKIFKKNYLFKFPDVIIPSISENLELLNENINLREKNARKYIELLKDHPKIILPKYKDGNGVSWRFSFLIKGDKQLEISKKLKRQGFDVSNWYPSTHKMFLPPQEYDPFEFNNSDYLEKHILNFWIHPGNKENNIEDICHALLKLLK
jgi:dTDP-4-amino-4,6-dideoxygalactose transaminase